MPKRFLATLLALSWLGAACGRPDTTTESGSAHHVRDSAGVRIVESVRPSWERPWVVAEEPLLRVGDLPGQPEYELFRVRGALRQPDGRLAIANGGSNELRWYSPTGEFIGSVGGTGEGPGEFVTLWALFRLGGDTIAVFDRQPQRVSAFDGDGRFVRSLQMPPVSIAFPTARFSDGAYVLMTGGVEISTDGPNRIERYPLEVFRYVEASASTETLATVPGFEVIVIPDERRPGMFVRSFRQFGRSTHVTADASGWIVADNERPLLEYRAPGGELEMLVRWAAPRRAVTPSDVRADVESQVAARDGAEIQAQVRRLWESHPAPPDTMPVFDVLVLDDDRNAWVREYAPRAEENPNRFYVFSPDGIWLGTVTAPVGLRILSIGADHVVGVTTTELGVEVVAVHRLDRSPSVTTLGPGPG